MAITRRKFLNRASRVAGASLGASAIGSVFPRIVKASAELRVMTFEGFVTDTIIADFVASTGAAVNRTLVASNDEYMAKLAASRGDYDVCDITTSFGPQAIRAKFIEPLDLSKIPNFTELSPEFQELKFYKSDGKTYGTPTYWGLVPLTFNADVIPTRNDFGVLFDPEFKGKIGMWDDLSSMAQVAAWMGIKDVWTMNDEDLEKVKAKLIEQKPLVRKYWTQAGEAVDLFASGELVASISWDYITQQLLKAGYHVRQPKYGDAMAWSDSLTIVAGTPNRELAHQFLNYMIGAKAQAQISLENLSRVTNPGARKFMDPKLWTFLNMDSGIEDLPHTDFWGEIPRRAKYLEIWNAVKAAPI